MTNPEYTNPSHHSAKFTCPHCNLYAQQSWRRLKEYTVKVDGSITHTYIETSACLNCKKDLIWLDEEIIYPFKSLAPKADANMPPDVKELYDEAGVVGFHSQRAAAALLRVALERLTVHLGEPTGKLNTRIGNLAKRKHLDERAIKGFDIVRVITNESGAHDGLIDLTGLDGANVIKKLFFLINYIIEKTLTETKKVDQMFGDLPEDKREGIKNRDKPTPGEKIQ
ncbi:MAG: DUF4145 domain-containing protein [Candidatus Halichondribacter symbioticus]